MGAYTKSCWLFLLIGWIGSMPGEGFGQDPFANEVLVVVKPVIDDVQGNEAIFRVSWLDTEAEQARRAGFPVTGLANFDAIGRRFGLVWIERAHWVNHPLLRHREAYTLHFSIGSPADSIIAAYMGLGRIASAFAGVIPQEFFPMHVGDTWVYGNFCQYYRGEYAGSTRLDGIITRVITHTEAIGGHSYFMTQESFQADSASALSLPANYFGLLRGNYRVDPTGNVYAYDPQYGVEFLLWRLNAEPYERWREYEGTAPADAYVWGKVEVEIYPRPQTITDWMVIERWDPIVGNINYGGVTLRRGIGIVSFFRYPGYDVECGCDLLRAVINGKEYEFRTDSSEGKTAVSSTSWGVLKKWFVKP